MNRSSIIAAALALLIIALLIATLLPAIVGVRTGETPKQAIPQTQAPERS